MPFTSPRLAIKKDDVAKVLKSIQELVGKDVLIGVPEKDDQRQDGSPMTNAALAYIHETGSPAANIPARPFLVPGVEEAEDRVTPQMKKAAQAALSGNSSGVETALNRAGLIAQSSVRNKINTGAFVPLSPDTIRNRKYSRGTNSRRAAEEAYLAAIKNGDSPEAAQSAAGIQPLINTGQLRNAIEYVIRKRK